MNSNESVDARTSVSEHRSIRSHFVFSLLTAFEMCTDLNTCISYTSNGFIYKPASYKKNSIFNPNGMYKIDYERYFYWKNSSANIITLENHFY